MVYTRTQLTGRRFSEASRRNIPRPPNFIRERRTVFYNHLPRHTVSGNDKDTLANRIRWVIVHPDLYSHIKAWISHLPEVKDLIDIYRTLARAAPSYGVIIGYNKKTSAPKSKKRKMDQVANEAYQAVIQAAEKVLSMLANPQIAGALSDLMPLYSSDFDEDKDKSSTPDPEKEAIKWGQTSVEESTPSLVSSRPDSSYSEVKSFDLLPELNYLELSTIVKLSEDKFHEGLKVAV
ncbi:hypothetical protein ONZ51_g12317 [Trametes cubensis]|uniref:Uncharacterized protein n=1 Tax=Trametes cubensis TaxID=1111947 RepID=A0AAD7X4Q1_9APHY|nr:hypothetical protein ONZ51_g12317 [Trametes cubensis]